jgi:two-component system chemotaxis sensor kinase CheA
VDKAKLMQRLMATFLDELEEHVRSLNQDLLALEKTSSMEERAERLRTLFRTAHSLKGAARSVNIGVIEGACHRLEEILAGARDGRLVLAPELFVLLFATADGFEEAAMRLREQQDLTGSPLADLLSRLDHAVAGTAPPVGPGPESPRLIPAPPPPPAVKAAPPTPPAPPSPAPVLPAPAPPAPPAPVAEAHAEPAAPAGSVRVPAEKLDTLLARIGELLVARRRVEARVDDLKTLQDFVAQWRGDWQRVEKLVVKFLDQEEDGPSAGRNGAGRGLPRRALRVLRQTGDHLRRLEKDLERLTTRLAGDGHLLRQVAGPLDDEVRRVRMLPFAEACQGLDRMARDLALAAGKEVDLAIEGGSVELDRSVLEGLKDPLRHLVRNAVDHGIEAPEKRRSAGKPPRGRVTITAALRGAQVEVTVRDDGRGLDLDALREQARRRKLSESIDEAELAHLIFLPGLSTARIITDVSGRGVGMDVVKSRVEALHGTVDLASTPGRGVCFTLTVPLTLTTLRAVLVGVGGQTFAFAGTNVQKLVRIRAADFRSVAGRDMLSLGGTPLPLAELAGVLGLPTAARAPAEYLPVLVVAAGDRRMAFAVDELLAEQEVVVKSLGPRIRHLRLVSGATLLPSGRIALVLNAAHLVRSALGRAPAPRPAAAPGEAAPAARKRLLVVDDSVTTRTLEKSILEAAGFEVATAVDGKAAWAVLQEQGADLVVSDVDMPQMDGFALTEAVRGSKRFHDLPVVLVTARESEQDKARGIEVGADAYLVKSAFDQKNLLETIAQLL